MFGALFCFRSCLVQCFVFGCVWCIVLFLVVIGALFCFRSCLVQCFVFGCDWCIVLF